MMQTPYSLLQNLEDDCNHVFRVYRADPNAKGRVKMLAGYMDKWDGDHGDGFFVKTLSSYIRKQIRKEKRRFM